MQTITDIKNLSLAFQLRDKQLAAVDKVSFRLIPGETLALLGESGCGKSISALALMRLLPQNTLYGQDSQILMGGEDLLDLPEQCMRQLRGRKLAMIFQEPMTALNPVLTIGQQLSEALTRQGSWTRKRLHERMLSLLSEVEIPEPELRLNHYPHQLSGGQKQRIVIAMALASNPEVLIADEPTTALDVTTQAQILALLKRLQEQHQMSLLLITHDLAVVKVMASRVCVMYAGQIVEQALVDDFFSEVKHPYSQQLLASMPSFALRHQRLSVISGSVPTLEQLPSGCRFHPRCPYVFERCSKLEPTLQSIDHHDVRCHLYPQQQELKALDHKGEAWSVRPKNTELLLSVQNLSVVFKQKQRGWHVQKKIFKAVDDLSFDLYKGQTLALVGESGCGKTTVSRALLQLIPASGGAVGYQGKNALAFRNHALRTFRKKVQIIFQDPFSAMNPRMTVGDILAEGMIAQQMSKKWISARQKALLNQVNLPQNSLTRYPHQFSGGQRQRICIARALATEPEILICDEPTSALDVSVQAQILNLLKELQEETGMAYLFITHNMGVVSYIADEVLVMKDGKVIESGPCERLLNAPQQAYTRELLSAVLEV